jgi:enoyl-CoA hydratase
LVYTGRTVPADEALAMGLAERVLPADAVLPGAIDEARRFARGPRSALAAAKASIAAATVNPGAAGSETEREAFLALFGTPDQREGMAAFLEKRQPRFGF